MLLGSPWEHLPERSCEQEHEGPGQGSDMIKAVQLLCSLKAEVLTGVTKPELWGTTSLSTQH